MSEQKITPQAVTKPIQLLAAWLVGLLSLNASFLLTASNIKHPTWAAGFLVVCAVINVPVFLICLFLLQTKFRPEMQEDQFYSKYLETRYSSDTGKSEIIEASVKIASVPAISSLEQAGPAVQQISRDVRICLNDMLEKYADIALSIVNSGYDIAEKFGSTSRNPSIPEKFVVSVSKDVGVDVFKDVMKILEDYNVELIGPINEISTSNTIYVGSYAFRNEKNKYLNYSNDVKNDVFSGKVNPKTIDAVFGRAGDK